MSLFAELKRRNVFRVGIFYAVLSWLILQVADVLFGVTQLPEWSLTLVAIILGLGFIPALIFAWVFELTPEGIKREAEVDRSISITGQTGRKLNISIAVMLAVAIGLLIYQTVRPPATVAPETSPASVASNESSPSASTEAEPGSSSLARGIAVLPFESLSGDEDNAYFAGGVHEDVLTHLSRIEDLRVISRTSMKKIAETDLDIRGIAERLDVSHVLEGSVRRAGNQVRVTVQLIDAATDEHLWAQNYDRKLEDIFAIQSEIAQAIAQRLEGTLSPESIAQMETASTTNLEAYDLYLRAREALDRGHGSEEYNEARLLLEQAVEEDGDFLPAKVLMAYVYGRLVWSLEDPTGEYEERATALVNELSKRWPERPETNKAIGDFHYLVQNDHDAALEAYRIALRDLPNDADLCQQIAVTLKRLGRVHEGLETIRRCITLNPESKVAWGELALLQLVSGRPDAAILTYQQVRERFEDPDWFPGRLVAAKYLAYGDTQPMIDWVEVHGPQASTLVTRYVAMVLAADERFEEALGLLPPFEAAGMEPVASGRLSLARAELHWLAGDVEEARRLAGQLLEALLNDHESDRARRFPKAYHSMIARVAALAGDIERMQIHRELAERTPAAEHWNEVGSDMELGIALALAGNPKAGWDLIQPAFETNLVITDWQLYHEALYRRLFGDLPEYQERVARLEDQPEERS